MKFRKFFIILAIAGYATAFDYDPVNDNYNPNDWAVEVLPVSTATDVYNANGTHSTLVYFQNKPDTSYKWVDKNGNPLGPRNPDQSIGDYQIMQITPNDGSLKKWCLDHMNYLNGYYRYIINIYTRTNIGPTLLNKGPVNNGYNVLVASGYLLGKPSNPAFQKVAIIADGIDFCDGMHLWTNSRCFLDVVTDPTYNTMLQPTGETTLGKGYNLCFVDFELGCADIRFNAKVMLKIIEKICELAGTNNITVGGLSMGGQVSRLALLYGQKIVNGYPAAKIQNVNKFISIDSPNKGASGFSESFQNFVFRNDKTTFYNRINQPASIQMLFVHTLSTPTTFEHDKFYSFLNAMGNFPKNIKLISIADANWVAPAHTGTCLTILLDGLPYDGFCWQPSDFLAGSTTGSVLSLIIMKATELPWYEGMFVHASIGQSPNCEPTFMPITSVFCLNDNTPANLQNANSLSLLVQWQWTPFQSLYLAPNRMAHITFDSALNSMICKALAEPGHPKALPSIINLLLN